ncbi:hypothetical protein Bca101_058213 [Brassica carinata]
MDGGCSSDRNLYEVIGVGATATQQEIRKAYHKLALRLHPDKTRTTRFNSLLLSAFVFFIVSMEKRAVYDQTGSVDDADLSGDVVDNLRDFFRQEGHRGRY